ncbi:DUF6879 family protein [Sphaerisporangium rhizosphaerae]|uniref:DUF6879 family protein n=1 Tax=Sphaerisporangium rhizosphaerae TaxID=2269375 RepID=A0ABW2P1P4_9ACTN
MLEQLSGLPAEVLDLTSYRNDFQENFWRVDASWKLERQITFKEPSSPSWVAMAEGHWEKSLRLADELRAARAEHQRQLDRHGITQRRVRFVCEPPTSYLQWELHLLMIWAELGEEIRILPADTIAHLETHSALPEVVVLGDRSGHPVMYDITYTDGVLAGARKFTDIHLVASCRDEIRDHWRQGEDLLRYFPKKIADLPPPAPQGV